MLRVVLIIIVLLVFLTVFIFALRWLNKPEGAGQSEQKASGKHEFRKSEQKAAAEVAAAKLRAQEFIGLADIVGPDIIMSDGSVVNIFSVQTINTSLLTTPEKIAEARRTARVLSTLKSGFKLVKLHRSADNTQQINSIKRVRKEVEEYLAHFEDTAQLTKTQTYERNFTMCRHRLLGEKLVYETEQEDQASERFVAETYISLRTPADKNSLKLAAESARQLLSRLAQNGYTAVKLTDTALIDVLKAYFDEPVSPKINLDPTYQIPYLTPDLRTAIAPQKEDIPKEPIVEAVPLGQSLPPQETVEDKQIQSLLAELDAWVDELKELEHVQ